MYDFLPKYDLKNVSRIGPAQIEHRTADSGFKELGTYVMTFDQEGHSDPWTVQYEETLYVVSGRARLVVIHDDGNKTDLDAGRGELIALPKGTTVQYGAEIGTELLLSISPVNWRATSEEN